jgi:type IV secretory pathway TrbF-like protein
MSGLVEPFAYNKTQQLLDKVANPKDFIQHRPAKVRFALRTFVVLIRSSNVDANFSMQPFVRLTVPGLLFTVKSTIF